MWIPAPGKLAVNGRFGNVGVPPGRLRADLLSRLFHPSAARQAAIVRSAAARNLATVGPAARTSRE